MNNFYYTGCIILLVSCLSACTDSAPTEQTSDSVSVATSGAENRTPLTAYSDKFREIVKTDEGVLRGIDFGDELDRVFIEEDTIPSEDSASYVTFTVELDNEEQELADVLYHFDGNRRVQRFTLDVYLKTQGAVDSLSQEFRQYYTERYGEPALAEPKTVTWNNAGNAKITMRDVGIKEAPGLQVQIARSE